MMVKYPAYMPLKDEARLAKDEDVLIQVLQACQSMKDHYFSLSPSGRSVGIVGFLYVDWHWISIPRVSSPEYHADAASQLLRNLPERDIRDAQRKWKHDMRPFSLPSYLDVYTGHGYHRVILHHRKVGF